MEPVDSMPDIFHKHFTYPGQQSPTGPWPVAARQAEGQALLLNTSRFPLSPADFRDSINQPSSGEPCTDVDLNAGFNHNGDALDSSL